MAELVVVVVVGMTRSLLGLTYKSITKMGTPPHRHHKGREGGDVVGGVM